MTSIFPLWWLALPVLLLPVWWHRQKRQRVKAELLATARFLPIAAPEQQRVWRWRDLILLAVRCLLLLGLIVWLAAMVFPWRGDTVLLDSRADRVWAEQQIRAAHMESAQRMAMPDDVLSWLGEHERDWRSNARLLIVAAPSQVGMPARVPQFAHAVDLRVQSPAAIAPSVPAPRRHHVVLATTPARRAAWQAMFAAFDVAGTGADRYVLDDEPNNATELIIWDQPTPAPADWRAPLWWAAAVMPTVTAPATPPVASALAINGISLQINDTPHGRIWSSSSWPAKDADTARAIYETWQALAVPAMPYPAPSQSFSTGKASAPAVVEPLAWLAWALLALFLLERILTHARRN